MTSSTFLPLSFIFSTYKPTHPSSAINATTTTTTTTTTTMDPQLLLPSPATEFNFNSTSTSPYTTAPSSPKLLFPKFPYTTQHNNHDNLEESEPEPEADHMDFAFDFSGQLEPPSISDADELFDGGKIKFKPLQQPPPPPQPPSSPPPPPPQSTNEALIPSTSAPMSNHNINSKPFSEAFRRTPKDQPQSSSLTSQFGFTWYNKWNLKNLLLFRSTSEGSATTIGDQSKKYGAITKGDEDLKNLSFRSCDGGGGGSSRRKMRRKMSAHELHYTANRSVAEEMRRRTSLPYKSGLLGCLGFSRNIHEASSRGRR